MEASLYRSDKRVAM